MLLYSEAHRVVVANKEAEFLINISECLVLFRACSLPLNEEFA